MDKISSNLEGFVTDTMAQFDKLGAANAVLTKAAVALVKTVGDTLSYISIVAHALTRKRMELTKALNEAHPDTGKGKTLATRARDSHLRNCCIAYGRAIDGMFNLKGDPKEYVFEPWKEKGDPRKPDAQVIRKRLQAIASANVRIWAEVVSEWIALDANKKLLMEIKPKRGARTADQTNKGKQGPTTARGKKAAAPETAPV